MKILIVEDNPKLRDNISKFLKISGFTSETAYNGIDGLQKMIGNNFDLIVLDINMPFLNGKEFTKKLRTSGKIIPIIALTSNSMLDDKLEMFELGVDDYMTKPFELKELLARINSLVKRKMSVIEEKIVIGKLEINILKHKIYYAKKELEFSNKEYLIIEFLVRSRGYPKSKTQILEAVWGELEENLEISSTTLETHISTIRKKISRNFIKTIKGVGYIIE
ncbi:MAG: response regulator transcription factor [Candidatus Gracilibacteria bacterium]|nr:response regulator transcription factor [Candidatus Gracilibacteria bacterium]